jgi:hypothetical protein
MGVKPAMQGSASCHRHGYKLTHTVAFNSIRSNLAFFDLEGKMKKSVTSLALFATVAVAGCASPDLNYVAQREKMAVMEDSSPLTGSRLNKLSTERILRAVGNKEYNEQRIVNSLGNEISLREKRPGG